MDVGFVTSKKQQVHHLRWQSFQFRFNSSQPKLFVISRILTAKFLYLAES